MKITWTIIWTIIAICFAYLAIGSIVVGIQIKNMKELPDGEVIGLFILFWPLVLIFIIMCVFCDLAKEIGTNKKS